MVQSQIQTMGVVSRPVLDGFNRIPREIFVPRDQQGICYRDEDVSLGRGRCLMDPAIYARLLQAADLTRDDKVLDVGCNTGYSSAVLSTMVGSVTALECDAEFLTQAKEHWEDLGLRNITPVPGKLTDGVSSQGPYSLIVINGAVSRVPQNLLDQLTVHGRLLGVVMEGGKRPGKAMIYRRDAAGNCSGRVLFDCTTGYLPGAEPRAVFRF